MVIAPLLDLMQDVGGGVVSELAQQDDLAAVPFNDFAADDFCGRATFREHVGADASQ